MARRRKTSFEGIKEGLEQALAYVQTGKPSPGMRVTEVEAPSVNVRAVRTKLGLSQPKMAALLGASPSGYRKWEQGDRMPSGPALVLLRIAEREPEAVLRALTGA